MLQKQDRCTSSPSPSKSFVLSNQPFPLSLVLLLIAMFAGLARQWGRSRAKWG